MRRTASNRGFSLIEMLIVMAVLGVLSAFTIPMFASTSSTIKLSDQANAVADLVGLAKMRAASQFSRARVYVDLGAGTYVMQLLDSTSGKWADEIAPVSLPHGVSFSFGKLDTPPPNTQDAIAFSAKCLDDAGDAVDNTACITFNSRGIPVDKDNSPIGGNAFYLTDGTGVRAVTVTATPLIRRWWSSAGKASWMRE